MRKNMAKVTRQLNDLFVEVMQAWIERKQDPGAGVSTRRLRQPGGYEWETVFQQGEDSAGKFWEEREP